MEKSRTCLVEDLLVEILLKLPVKSLGQFRCVCKSWHQIISSTFFINAQKNTISNTNSPYLLCSHTRFYSVLHNEELTNYRPSYYRPKLFGIKLEIDLRIKVYGNCEAFSRPEVDINLGWGIKVHGSCKGLLCVSEKQLYADSIIYLLNPIILRVKRIPKICMGGQVFRQYVDFCLGYVDDDYKLIKIAASASSRGYCVGVYSLRSDCWKTTYCDHDDDGTSRSFNENKFSRFVNGVAYFVKDEGGIICFDLYDERIRDIMLPKKFYQSRKIYNSFELEVYGESIALMEVNKGVFAMWVLENCGITKKSTWEKKVTIALGRAAAAPIGFLNSCTYLLRNKYGSGNFYLCNLENSERKGFTDGGEPPSPLSHIDSFVGNLVLLNEQTIDPFAETEPCSNYATFLFNINREEKKKRLHKRENKLQQGKHTKRKIEKREMEKK